MIMTRMMMIFKAHDSHRALYAYTRAYTQIHDRGDRYN